MKCVRYKAARCLLSASSPNLQLPVVFPDYFCINLLKSSKATSIMLTKGSKFHFAVELRLPLVSATSSTSFTLLLCLLSLLLVSCALV